MVLILLRITALNNGAEYFLVIDIGLGKVFGALCVVLDSLVNIKVAMINERSYRMNVSRSIVVKPLVKLYGLTTFESHEFDLDGSV